MDVANETRLCDYLPLIEGLNMHGEGGLDYPEEVASVYALEAFYSKFRYINHPHYHIFFIFNIHDKQRARISSFQGFVLIFFE